MSEYQLTLNDKRIAWGALLDVEPLIGSFNDDEDAIRKGTSTVLDWNLPSGIYRAKDAVIGLDKLLEAMLVQLGEPINSDPTVLLDSLQANLAVSGRESSLPLGPLAFEDWPGKELTGQAKRIGEQLVNWAREINSQKRALSQYGEETLEELEFRSHCYHHKLTPDAVAQVFGPSGGSRVMQLYNEYIHQFVLLRDALLPFSNWEEVPFEIKEHTEYKGLRFIEAARKAFLTQLLGRDLSHKSIVQYAQHVVCSDLSKAGYGFQYRLGTILPASLGVSALDAPRYLLKWHPVQTIKLDEAAELTAVSFEYAYEDYYAAPRSEAGSGTTEKADVLVLSDSSGLYAWQPSKARLSPHTDADRTKLNFIIEKDGREYAVDLGQMFRGHRFSYRPLGSENREISSDKLPRLSYHHAIDILSHPGLVTNTEGVHFIHTGTNELVSWAVLGKLYPENVILLDKADREELSAAHAAGKGYGAKFFVL
ncbi:hypothetical protein [Paenibacillus radicis (ex Gao et al. 2016)]|uniref:Uncharacterized protein n=1 Tax=Paenibacillus radicis (ex Gao et al. 2016) TaxID=1737354 RepID=A0A917H5I7_9BACL|nr:hypothetical protein [Paenibacillus radicis (ex Gao et al. 2016)]GGG68348.1 hypothetical protein GCM10010918_24030 [Paenibacillus radicis (ex Gao et al. 2016)]